MAGAIWSRVALLTCPVVIVLAGVGAPTADGVSLFHVVVSPSVGYPRLLWVVFSGFHSAARRGKPQWVSTFQKFALVLLAKLVNIERDYPMVDAGKQEYGRGHYRNRSLNSDVTLGQQHEVIKKKKVCRLSKLQFLER